MRVSSPLLSVSNSIVLSLPFFLFSSLFHWVQKRREKRVVFYLNNCHQSRLFDGGARIIIWWSWVHSTRQQVKLLTRHRKGQYAVRDIRDFQMRLQKQLKLFLSYFLQVSIVRGSVVTPWLSTRKMFFSVTRAKKRYAKSAKQKLEHLKTSIMSPPIQFQNNAELLRSQPFCAGSTSESLKSKLSVTLGHLPVDRNCRQLLLSF